MRHVGENRHQEAVAKADECADLDLTWHFIGGLQSNKAAAVASYADVVQSLDRAKLVSGLSRGALERGRDLEVLVQVEPRPAGRRRPLGRRARPTCRRSSSGSSRPTGWCCAA